MNVVKHSSVDVSQRLMNCHVAHSLAMLSLVKASLEVWFRVKRAMCHCPEYIPS